MFSAYLKKTLYYQRDTTSQIKISNTRKNKLKEGDEIIFNGHLFSDKKHTKPLAKTSICYKIASILKNGMIITASLCFKFSDGEIEFMGNIFSSTFGIENGSIKEYTTIPENLSVIRGTNAFKSAHGNCKYVINGPGVGDIKMNVSV